MVRRSVQSHKAANTAAALTRLGIVGKRDKFAFGKDIISKGKCCLPILNRPIHLAVASMAMATHRIGVLFGPQQLLDVPVVAHASCATIGAIYSHTKRCFVASNQSTQEWRIEQNGALVHER